MATITNYRAQWRRGTLADLTSENPTPEEGEVIYETDTNKFKIGNTAGDDYNTLSYFESGGAGNLQVPQPKTWVEKWNDGGVGTVTSKVNEWGTGKYIIYFDPRNYSGAKDNYQTEIIEVRDITQSVEGVYVGTVTTEQFLEYNASSGAFQFSSSSNLYIIAISRWEDDPDNLPLLEIPADPGIIKDWVNKFDDDTNTSNVPNTTGIGYYRFSVRRTSSTELFSTIMYLTDLSVDSKAPTLVSAGGATLNGANVQYNTSTNDFSVTDDLAGDFYINSIDRFEDVAATDAQLNPPVDGWETVFDGTPATSVTNIWGAGVYEVHIDGFSGSSDIYVGEVVIKEENIGNTDIIWAASYTSGTNVITAQYQSNTNDFKQYAVGFTGGNIVRIRKFNSLVNVYHSYQATVIEINTDGGDVDASSYFTTPSQGKALSLYNAGTSGNDITGTPDSVDVTDGLAFEYRYGSSKWFKNTITVI